MAKKIPGSDTAERLDAALEESIDESFAELESVVGEAAAQQDARDTDDLKESPIRRTTRSMPAPSEPSFGDWLIEQLGESGLFSGLGRAHLARIVEFAEAKSFKRNEHIFKQGDAGAEVFVVLDGSVRISRTVPGMGEEAFAVLRPGSAFGEMVIIDDSARSADALAHESCTILAIDKDQLQRLMFVDRALASELLWKLVRLLAGRLRETNDKMTFLSITGRFE